MANKTVYPYGTGGQLPSSVGIVNDLVTGGSDKALSAQQGVVIGEYLFNRDVPVDISSLAINNYGLGTSAWTSKGKHSVIPVVRGDVIKVGVLTSEADGGFYAFLTSSYEAPSSASSVPPYCYGTNRFWRHTSDGVVTVTAPSDAAYFCFCPKDGAGLSSTWSISKLDKADITDDFIEKSTLVDDLVTGGSENVLSARQGAILHDAIGNGFFDAATKVDLTTLTVQNCTIGSTSWYRGTSPNRGLHIAFPVIPEHIYDLSLSADAPADSFYCFVTSSYNPPYANNNSIPFVSSQTGRYTLARGSSIKLTAPSDAAYLCLVYEDGASLFIFPYWSLSELQGSVLPKTVEQRIVSLEGSEFTKIRVLHWNVGHFALGANYDTTISQANLETMRTKWRDKLNPIAADIVITCEYNTNFVNASGNLPAVTARDAVFSEEMWKYAAIGTKPSANSYMQTAIFSNIKLHGSQQITFPQTVQAGRYYQLTTIYLGGKEVKLVETHLDWNQGDNGAAYRAAQIQKLITDFADSPYVILGADFNVSDSSEFDAFLNAGYNMLNHGYKGDLPTHPADNPVSPLDNIICKGFTISNINVIEDNNKELSDHLGVYADFSIIV